MTVSTTSFRPYGDKQTAQRLRYFSEQLLARVQQEMFWNKIPSLKRTFRVSPCAQSPMGAVVEVICTYGVNNINVYVPFMSRGTVQREDFTEKIFLHLKIFPKEETERKSFSLVWDIEKDGFPVDDFGINGIVKTGSISEFLSKTVKDSKPLYGADGNEFNDALQERTVIWGQYETTEPARYHIPVLEELSSREEVVDYALYLEQVGETIIDTTIWGKNPKTYDNECLTSCDCDNRQWGESEFVDCLKDVYWGNPIRETWEAELDAIADLETGQQLVTNQPALNYIETWVGMNNDKQRESLTGVYLYDETPAKVRAVSSSPSGLAEFTLMGCRPFELFQNSAEGYSIETEEHKTFLNSITVDRTHYLTAFLFFQDYLFYLYNTASPAIHNGIKAPILPSFSVNTAGGRPVTEFNVKLQYDMDIDIDIYTGRTTLSGGYDPDYGWYKWIGTDDSYPGNNKKNLFYQTFEFFTPLGSIGTISCKCEAYRNYTWCGDWRGLSQNYHGIDSVQHEELNVRFFFGRPSYLGTYGTKGIAQIYAYDFNYHDITAFPIITGLQTIYEGETYLFSDQTCYYPNHDNVARITPSFDVQTVEECLVRGQRQLIVGASITTNPNTPLREMARNAKLEQAVRDLFDTYYTENSLDNTRVDEDYKVELELRILKASTKKEV